MTSSNASQSELERDYPEAVQYIKTHSLDGRYLDHSKRQHLIALLHDMAVPSDVLARMLRIPRWLLARKIGRLRLRKTLDLAPKVSLQGNRGRVISEYIATHAIDGTSVTRDELHYLLNKCAIAVSDLAALLRCHEELLIRKAKRWRLPLWHEAEPESVTAVKVSQGPKVHPLHIEVPKDLATRRLEIKRDDGRINLAREYMKQHGIVGGRIAREHLETLYTRFGLSANAIGKLLGRSARTVLYWLKANGIDTRDIWETRVFRTNATFFSNWSAEMAWVLGLLFTDGNLMHGQVRLATKDRELPEKVRDLIAPQREINVYANSPGRYLYSFGFNHPQVLADLIRLGLTENKSLTMRFPDIPKPYLRHFIRGCWDGDGGFTKPGPGKLVASYTCGSREFIEQLSMALFEVGIGAKRESEIKRAATREKYGFGSCPLKIYARSGARAFDLRFGSPLQLGPFYALLYEGVSESICLKRKHDILKDYVLGLAPS